MFVLGLDCGPNSIASVVHSSYFPSPSRSLSVMHSSVVRVTYRVYSLCMPRVIAVPHRNRRTQRQTQKNESRSNNMNGGRGRTRMHDVENGLLATLVLSREINSSPLNR